MKTGHILDTNEENKKRKVRMKEEMVSAYGIGDIQEIKDAIKKGEKRIHIYCKRGSLNSSYGQMVTIAREIYGDDIIILICNEEIKARGEISPKTRHLGNGRGSIVSSRGLSADVLIFAGVIDEEVEIILDGSLTFSPIKLKINIIEVLEQKSK